MANVFLTLAVPAGDGVGAATDVSGLAPFKTLVVTGSSSGVVIVEATENDVDYFPIGRVDVSSDKSRPIEFVGVLKKIRVRRIFSNPASPLPTVTLGAETTAVVQVFGALDTPVDNGYGVVYDCSASGNLLTFSTLGTLSIGILIVEGSQDGGVTFNALARFDGPWDSKNQLKPIIVKGNFNRLRVKKEKALSGTGGIQFGQGELDQETAGSFPGYYASVPAPDAVTGLPGVSPFVSHGDHVHPLASNIATVATWTDTVVRYYAVDNDAGLDANAGFSDVSMAAAGAVAKKTWGAVLAILPRVGAGRKVVIAIKPRAGGATYLQTDGVTVADLVLRGFAGYRYFMIGGTTDFSNSATDKVVAGAMQSAVGPNGDGSWSVGAGATTISVPLNAGAFPADPAIAVKRIRWVTGALAGTVTWVRTHTATTFEPGTVLAAIPALGDTFFVEQPGVAFSKVQISGEGMSVNPAPELAAGDFMLRGLAAVSNTSSSWAVRGPARRVSVSFCENRGGSSSRSVFDKFGNLSPNPTYTDEAGTSISTGVGFRDSGGISFVDLESIVLGKAVGCVGPVGTGSTALTNVRRVQLFSGRFTNGVRFASACGGRPVSNPTATGAGDVCLLGEPGATQINERLIISGEVSTVALLAAYGITGLSLHGVELINSGALPCVLVNAIGAAVRFDDVVGSAGNTDVALTLVDATGCTVQSAANNPNTVTGTSGDVRLAGPAIATWADLSRTNVIDNRGNELIGPGGRVVSDCMLLANLSGVALVVGDVCKPNGTSGQLTKAQADTIAKADGARLVAVCGSAAAASGYFSASGTPSVNFNAGPTAGAIAYLHNAAAGLATTTVPAISVTAAKLRMGRVLTVSGTTGRVAWKPEFIPVLGDGVA
jgi:hypothetical protein